MQCIWECKLVISFLGWSPSSEGDIFWVPIWIGFEFVMMPAKWTLVLLVVANRDWTCGLGKGFDFPTLDIWRSHDRRIDADALGAPSLILSWSCVFVPKRTSISLPGISWQACKWLHEHSDVINAKWSYSCSAPISRVFKGIFLERKPWEELYHDMVWDGLPQCLNLRWSALAWPLEGIAPGYLSIEDLSPWSMMLGDLL